MKAKQITTWTIDGASREFGCSRTKLASRLSDCGAKPDSNGKFTTKQICEALFGSAHQARLREANARAELAEARTAILHRKWLPVDLTEAAWRALVTTFRQRLRDIPGSIADAATAGKVRSEIDSALKDLAQTETEKFYETETEKSDITDDEDE
jgi:hypothetical protein